jgi:14-3-3 protein epsilon
LRNYKKKIEEELNKFCDDILNLLDNNLVKNSANSESKVFFLKMKGDYHRYISEYAQGNSH